jgi:hypothetical protein
LSITLLNQFVNKFISFEKVVVVVVAVVAFVVFVLISSIAAV